MKSRKSVLGVTIFVALGYVRGGPSSEALGQCQLGQPRWTRRSTTGPSARQQHAMAYDQARGVTVLFGGSTGRDETWEWDGNTWTMVAITAPSPRLTHAMSYDSARGVTVLFGGHTGGSWLGDTWEWDGATWELRATNGPSRRNRHAMVYDIGRSKTVLFGGYLGSNRSSSQTWEWDGTSWALRSSTGPVARSEHSLAYDIGRGKTVLFGGRPSGVASNDTWEWNGASWTERVVTAPTRRSKFAMAYHRTRHATVLFGGDRPYTSASDETYEWDGESWIRRSSGSPAGREGHAMAYDSARKVVVLFGGTVTSAGVSRETWEYGCPDGPLDCNRNCILDECDIDPADPDGDGFVSLDCNGNNKPDECDLLDNDCNGDEVPDGCQDDCNSNGFPDDCDIADEVSKDCNANHTPDECDIAAGTSLDCQLDNTPDECQIGPMETNYYSCLPTADDGAFWCDDFEGYFYGSIHGINLWQGWGVGNGDPLQAGNITFENNHTGFGFQSLKIENHSTVRLFHGYDPSLSRYFIARAWVYIPGNMTGDAWYMIHPDYDGGDTETNWAVNIKMESLSRSVRPIGGLPNISLPLVTDRWVEIVVEIDFVLGRYDAFYDGEHLANGNWQYRDGSLNIAAIDLYGDETNGFFVDDLALYAALDSDCNSNQVPDECEPVREGDFDGNAIVDLADYSELPGCMSGPNIPLNPSCMHVCLKGFDVHEQDDDVDLADIATILQRFGNP